MIRTTTRSTPPQGLYRVEACEFDPCLTGREAPSDGGFGGVALPFPSGNFLLYTLSIWEPTFEALAG